jgi:high-affinity iron transporter
VGASFLIGLREGLEISLIVAIVLAYLKRTDRTHLFRPVLSGAAAAIAVCIAAGVAFYFGVEKELHGKTEALVEGGLAISAVAVLTWMIFWMREHARGLSGVLQARVDQAISRSEGALAVFAFVAVAREGFETVLFLLGAKTNTQSGTPVVVGGLIGLVIASFLGYLVYEGGHRVDLRKFFLVTGALLILFGAGLFGKGLHELLVGVAGLKGGLADSLWTLRSGPLAHGWFNDFLGGMFGWTRDEASPVRVVGYLVYLLPIGWLYVLGGRPKKPAPADVREKAPAAA